MYRRTYDSLSDSFEGDENIIRIIQDFMRCFIFKFCCGRGIGQEQHWHISNADATSTTQSDVLLTRSLGVNLSSLSSLPFAALAANIWSKRIANHIMVQTLIAITQHKWHNNDNSNLPFNYVVLAKGTIAVQKYKSLWSDINTFFVWNRNVLLRLADLTDDWQNWLLHVVLILCVRLHWPACAGSLLQSQLWLRV